MKQVPLHDLREKYCAKCKVKALRSTGVNLLEKVIHEAKLVVDYGCSTWRNSKYLEERLKCETVRLDINPTTRPDVVSYPTHLPLKAGCADIVLLTHVLMFLRGMDEVYEALSEGSRVSSSLLVIECYHVKASSALRYERKELEKVFKNLSLSIMRKRTRTDMENYVLTKT